MSTGTTPLKPGDQLAGAESSTKVVVIRIPPGGEVEITCGGVPMVPAASAAPRPPDPAGENGTVIGKRYENPDSTVELLCTASGQGELAVDGVPLTIKAAKPLPASD